MGAVAIDERPFGHRRRYPVAGAHEELSNIFLAMLPQHDLVDGQCRVVECTKFVKHFSKGDDISFGSNIDRIGLQHRFNLPVVVNRPDACSLGGASKRFHGRLMKMRVAEWQKLTCIVQDFMTKI
ncbi:hypothetical protein AWB81_08635 [Caballeronia arationis]|nr:hypothetical protein AWB81_08635 [Caballeronia arationis]